VWRKCKGQSRAVKRVWSVEVTGSNDPLSTTMEVGLEEDGVEKTRDFPNHKSCGCRYWCPCTTPCWVHMGCQHSFFFGEQHFKLHCGLFDI
jgi:hypothetical protein